ncbi:MAG: M20/M25/M40 family metallo-hydrolase [Solobacterium sp.]|nr:M20/M25/M40 family metallo-hydrolase [Solobacterium sp.]MDY5401548.1 M20/M25/M40 family metallo-hydrolase [Erysipelotrichaceae bacterium]
MFEATAPHINFPMNVIFSNLNLFSNMLVKLIPNMNATAGEMLGTGCTFKNFNTLEDGSCEAEAFLRCISGDDLAKDIDTLKDMAKKYDVEIDVKDNEYNKPSSLDSNGYKHIRDTILSVFDYVAAIPFILPAGTDARTFTDLSDAVIRFAPIDIDNQQYGSVHNDDENFSVDKLGLVVKFYKELLKKYK